MPAGIIGQATTACRCGTGGILRMGVGSLQEALEGDMPLGHTGHTLTGSQETDLVSCIFHGREVGIQLVAVPEAEQGGYRVLLRSCEQGTEEHISQKENSPNHQTSVIVRSFHLPHPAGSYRRRGHRSCPLRHPLPQEALPAVRSRAQGNG